MTKRCPINCVQTHKRLAELCLDDQYKPVLFLWCKNHRTEHVCSLATMTQSLREMAKGNKQALIVQQAVLRKALGDVEADLEDLTEQEKAVG